MIQDSRALHLGAIRSQDSAVDVRDDTAGQGCLSDAAEHAHRRLVGTTLLLAIQCSSLRMSRSPRPTHLRLTAIPGPPKYSDPPPATPKRWRFEQAPYPCGRATSKIDVEYVAKQFVEREGSQTDIMWSEIDLDPPDPLHSRIPDLTRRAQRLST